MTKLFIPACGDRITLTHEWTFSLFNEHRNNIFAKECGITLPSVYMKSVLHTIPAGTQLECERVYIRIFSKSARSVDEDFDSVAWKIVGANKKRFWAKLSECCQIEHDDSKIVLYKDRILIEENEKKLDKKLTSDKIREILNNAVLMKRGQAFPFMQGIADVAAATYSDAVNRAREFHQRYEQHINAQNEKDRAVFVAYGFGCFHPRSTNHYQRLMLDEFTTIFQYADGADCKFVKANGQNVRKFKWKVNEDFTNYHYYRSRNMHPEIQGYTLDVITDEKDENIVSITLVPPPAK